MYLVDGRLMNRRHHFSQKQKQVIHCKILQFLTAAASCLSFYTSTVSIYVSGLCKLLLNEALLLKQHQGQQQHQVTAIINALQKTAIRQHRHQISSAYVTVLRSFFVGSSIRSSQVLEGCHKGCHYSKVCSSTQSPSSTGMPHRMQLLRSLQQHPASAAPQVLAECNYSTVCSSTQPPLLHRFLQNATTPQSAAAPSLRCSTGSCWLPQRMQLIHCLQQHPASAAPQVLAGCNYSTVCSSTQPPLPHRFLQVATTDATTPLSAAAPSLRCSTGSCRM